MNNLPPDFGQLAREADKRARLVQVKLDELAQRQAALLAEVIQAAKASSSDIFNNALQDKQPGSFNAVLNAARVSINSAADRSKRATTISYAVLAACVLCAVIAIVCTYFSYTLAKGTDDILAQEKARRAVQQESVAPRAKHK